MEATFWSKCSAAVLACRKSNFDDAMRLVGEAESLIGTDHSGDGVDDRRTYLDKLQSHVETLASGALVLDSSASSPYSQPEALDANYDGQLGELERLKQENAALIEFVDSLPAVNPEYFVSPEHLPLKEKEKEEKEAFGIIVFGFTRLDTLKLVLESLGQQDALKFTEVWLDGDQGNSGVQKKLLETANMVKQFPVKHLHTQRGNFGFRKMLILGLMEMSRKYEEILILEDDCFPVRDAVTEFRKGLDLIRNDPGVFSVYGHHFLVEDEKETCGRFQGWGWATSSEKLIPILRQLIDCYSMSEENYLEFVRISLTDDIRKQIEVTPPRLPSYCLEYFFAWDETVCLLTALNNQVHMPTRKRVIYNCGMGDDSAHFQDAKKWREPPFNLVTPEEVWQYF